ncbi:MAG: hypothetical protein NT166_23885 [Candidatus Aminicenantes bacterium]|nr:hypothetical protein [Candidatus Aminicenantes bacterium]
MEKKEKLDMLRRLNESRLREDVLVPLFEKMGFKVPPTSHVPNPHLSIFPQSDRPFPENNRL